MARPLRWLGALVCAATLVAAVGAPAAAHGDEGTMTVVVAEQAGPNRMRLEVGLVYANDDDLAVDATVTANLTGPGGALVGPVALQNSGPTSARYVADVDVPTAGTWQVTVTSESPAATTTAIVAVVESAPPTTAPSTTAPGGPSTTDAAARSSGSRADGSDGSGGDDGGFGAGALAALVGVGVAGAGLGAFVVTRRRRS